MKKVCISVPNKILPESLFFDGNTIIHVSVGAKVFVGDNIFASSAGDKKCFNIVSPISGEVISIEENHSTKKVLIETKESNLDIAEMYRFAYQDYSRAQTLIEKKYSREVIRVFLTIPLWVGLNTSVFAFVLSLLYVRYTATAWGTLFFLSALTLISAIRNAVDKIKEKKRKISTFLFPPGVDKAESFIEIL